MYTFFLGSSTPYLFPQLLSVHTHTHTHTLYYFGSHDMLSPDIMTLPPKHLFCLPQKQRPSTELHDHYHTECNKQ